MTEGYGWDPLMRVATSGDPWKTGVGVVVQLVIMSQLGGPPRTGSIDGVLASVEAHGVTITQTSEATGEKVVVLYPWHRVLSVTRVDAQGDDHPGMKEN